MIDVMKYANYKLDVFKPGEMECMIDELNFIRKYDKVLLNYVIEELNSMGLYPVWNMPGHRRTYYFPTECDCELWEDWLWDLKENG